MIRIRQLRKQKGYSGEKLGELVGVGKSAISKYERGDIQPSNDVLLKIANYLGTSTDYLLENTHDPTPPNKKKEAASPEEGGTYVHILGKDGMHRKIYVPPEKTEKLEKMMELMDLIPEDDTEF